MNDEKNNQKGIGLFVKGMAMGAADVVPGVSGGTIAFITGIYEELIDSLTSCNLRALKLLFSGRLPAFWEQINGTFLLIVFGGILFSIFSLAKGISWVLLHHPKIIWGYFFGLILASVFYIASQFKLSDWRNVLMMILGALVAFKITGLTHVQMAPTQLFVFIAGAIAICAMILPGISGSFILLILGMYQYIIEAVHQGNGAVLGLFVLGCISGLLSFTHLLSWLLHRFHALTLSVLTGFMLGSLNKIWPWKTTNNTTLSGEMNLWPSEYQALTQSDPQLVAVVVALLAGLLTVFLINRAGYAKPVDTRI